MGVPFALVAVGFLSTRPVNAESPIQYQMADLRALQDAFVELAREVRPCVVAIRTYQLSDPNNSTTRSVLLPYSQGSGFIIDSDGYVATNRHVIFGSDVVTVILDSGMKHEAEVVQSDPRSDLAVLKVDAEDLPAARFGDASQLNVNQWVFASGNPFGLANENGNPSITYGVVSAMDRRMTRRLVGDSNVEYYGNMIETSATINPGNSGGPLFNIDGEVIGVVTAIETSSGVSEGHGFAIPVDQNTRRVIELLKSGSKIRYGFLGVEVEDLEPPASSLVAEAFVRRGAVLSRVSFIDGPAARAGLRPRDVVIEYNGEPVQNADHFVRLVGFTPVGTQVPVTFVRDGIKRTATVTVADRTEMLSRMDRTD